MLLSWERQHRLPTRQMLYVLNIFFTLNSTLLFAFADTGNELIDVSRHMAGAFAAPRGGGGGGWGVYLFCRCRAGYLTHARARTDTQRKTHINDPQSPKHTHRHTSACMENVAVCSFKSHKSLF